MSDWFWDNLGWVLGGLILLLLVALIAAGRDRERLVQQCMADGRKEYECRAMFRENTTYVPMVIPVR
jgi:hypothetical protein